MKRAKGNSHKQAEEAELRRSFAKIGACVCSWIGALVGSVTWLPTFAKVSSYIYMSLPESNDLYSTTGMAAPDWFVSFVNPNTPNTFGHLMEMAATGVIYTALLAGTTAAIGYGLGLGGGCARNCWNAHHLSTPAP